MIGIAKYIDYIIIENKIRKYTTLIISETCLVNIVFGIIVKQVLLSIPAEHMSAHREPCLALQDLTDSCCYQQIEFPCLLVMLLECECLWEYVCVSAPLWVFSCVCEGTREAVKKAIRWASWVAMANHSQPESESASEPEPQMVGCSGWVGVGWVCVLVGCWS